MASYPTAVKTFTTKSDGSGNKVFAAHINEIQDEVTAIEGGLLNGTAPVSCSRVTAAGTLSAGAGLLLTSEGLAQLSSGDTYDLAVSGLSVVYVVTNSSGSTLGGMVASANGQTVMVWCAGPQSLGLKSEAAGAATANQLALGGDTSLAPGRGRVFYKSAQRNQWVSIG